MYTDMRQQLLEGTARQYNDMVRYTVRAAGAAFMFLYMVVSIIACTSSSKAVKAAQPGDDIKPPTQGQTLEGKSVVSNLVDDESNSSGYSTNLPPDIVDIIKGLKPKKAEDLNGSKWYDSAIKTLNSDGSMDKLMEFGAYNLKKELSVDQAEKVSHAFNELAFAYDLKGKDEKAIRYYMFSINVFEKAVIVFNLGYCYLDKKNYEEALQYFQRAKEIGFQNVPKVNRKISEAQGLLKDQENKN